MLIWNNPGTPATASILFPSEFVPIAQAGGSSLLRSPARRYRIDLNGAAMLQSGKGISRSLEKVSWAPTMRAPPRTASHRLKFQSGTLLSVSEKLINEPYLGRILASESFAPVPLAEAFGVKSRDGLSPGNTSKRRDSSLKLPSCTRAL